MWKNSSKQHKNKLQKKIKIKDAAKSKHKSKQSKTKSNVHVSATKYPLPFDLIDEGRCTEYYDDMLYVMYLYETKLNKLIFFLCQIFCFLFFIEISPFIET